MGKKELGPGQVALSGVAMSDSESETPANLLGALSPDSEAVLAVQWGPQRAFGKGQQRLPWKTMTYLPSRLPQSRDGEVPSLRDVESACPSSVPDALLKEENITMDVCHSVVNEFLPDEPDDVKPELDVDQSEPDFHQTHSSPLNKLLDPWDEAWHLSPEPPPQGAGSESNDSSSPSSPSSSSSSSSASSSPAAAGWPSTEVMAGPVALDDAMSKGAELPWSSSDWEIEASVPLSQQGQASCSGAPASRSPRSRSPPKPRLACVESFLQAERSLAGDELRGSQTKSTKKDPVAGNQTMNCVRSASCGQSAVFTNAPKPQPRALPGVDHWLQPLWSAISPHMRDNAARRVTLESLCTGTAAELHALEVLTEMPDSAREQFVIGPFLPETFLQEQNSTIRFYV